MLRHRLQLAAILSVLPAAAATAEPLKFHYLISGIETCTLAGCVAADIAPFRVGLSFDGEITRNDQSPTERVMQFGAPTFTDIDLPLPSLPASAFDAFRHTIDIATFLNGDWIHTGSAFRETHAHDDLIDYRQVVQLYANRQGLSAAPGLGAATLGTFLADPEAGHLFSFGMELKDRATGEFLPGTLVYRSFAVPVLDDEPAPVPEPASMVLLSSGLAVVGAKLRRRSRNKRRAVGNRAPPSFLPTCGP